MLLPAVVAVINVVDVTLVASTAVVELQVDLGSGSAELEMDSEPVLLAAAELP